MARPHTEFVHTQQLPWKPEIYPSLPGVECKVLSRDEEDGACSLLLRYPPGWRQDGALHFAGYQELYVLEGDFEINGQSYDLDYYGFLPAGYVYESASTKNGCDMIACFSAEPEAIAGAPEEGAYDVSDATPCVNTHEVKWSSQGIDPTFEWLEMHWKLLRGDPNADVENTFLLVIPPHHHPPDWMDHPEWHDCVEETWLLCGDLYNPKGAWRDGMYFYRPPGIAHGPWCTRFGCVMFIRCDGRLINHWVDPKAKLTLHPPHEVDLPPELLEVAGQPYEHPPRY